MFNLTEAQKAYLAALIDGEGTIAVERLHRKENRSKFRYQAAVYVTNTHLGVLQMCKDVLGGKGSIVRKTPTGPEVERFKRVKVCYRYLIKQTGAVELLKLIKPYLVIKRVNADNVLDFQEYLDSLPANNYEDYSVEERHKFWVKSRVLNGAKLENLPTVHNYSKDTRVAEVVVKPELRAKVDTTSSKLCSVEGCSGKHYGRDLCRKHYRRKYESKYNHNPETKRACKQCGKDISDLRPDKLVCSLSCKSKWHRANNKLKCTEV